MTRTPRLLAVLGLAVLLLAGCGDAAREPGAAAVVGDQRITVDDLREVVDRGLADPQARQQFGTDRAEFQRNVLSRLLRGRLLDQAARDKGVQVSQGQVDARLAEFSERAGGREQLEKQAAAGGVAAEDLPRFAREVVVEEALGDELTQDVVVPQEQLQAAYQQNIGAYEQVRSRHILVADEAQARDLLAKVQADPSTFAALAAQFSTDESNKAEGGELGWQGKGTFVAPFDELVFSTPVGSFGVVQTQFGWHVVQVEERRSTSLEEATPELRRAALEQQRTAAVDELLAKTADDLGVEVSPRFGQWDEKSLTVVASSPDDDASSPQPGAGSGAQAPAPEPSASAVPTP